MTVGITSAYSHKIIKSRNDLIQKIAERNVVIRIIGPEKASEFYAYDYNRNIKYLQLRTSRGNTNIIIEFLALIRNVTIFRKAAIDYLIVYGIKLYPSVVIAARIAGIKNITCIVNGLGTLFIRRDLKTSLIRIIAQPTILLSLLLSQHIIFQNKDDLADILRRMPLVSRRKCTIVNGSGVSIKNIRAEKITNYHRVLMTSRLLSEKGVSEFADAAKILRSNYNNNLEFVFAGIVDSSSPKGLYVKLYEFERQGILKCIFNCDNVIQLIRDSYIFVFPSYREGTPRAVLEAMAVGRPIITTDVPGCKETVIDGYNGFIVPIKSPHILAEKIKSLLDDKALGKLMAENSRRLCEQKFDEERINSSIVNIIFGSSGKMV